MNELFLTILNMSLTGAYVIAAICALRLALKKAPKIISYCLWSVAGFRLLFPFSFESVVSLIPFNSHAIPHDIATQAAPRIETGVRAVDNFVSASLPAATPNMSVNPLQIWTEIGAYLWFIGAAALMLYGVISYFVLKRKMRHSKPAEGNILEADNIRTPFVLGILSPKIYIPETLMNHERDYIILHEQTHIRRGDHIIKFAAYFLLCLHWFNPLAWAAFMLMGADMEMSCDERVIKEMKGDNRFDYSRSLLSLASERRFVGGSPLAFGEGGVKARIKNVLGFKKRSRLIVICSVALALVFAVGFTVNKTDTPNDDQFVPYMVFDNIHGTSTPTPWEDRPNIIIEEFPDVQFKWKFSELRAVESGRNTTLLRGWPVWSLFIADLTGDGKPELCTTVTKDMTFRKFAIKAYDYVNGVTYELSDSTKYDYRLTLEGTKLIAKQMLHNGDAVATGELKLVDGVLAIEGVEAAFSAPKQMETTSALGGEVVSVRFFGGGSDSEGGNLKLTTAQKNTLRDMMDGAKVIPLKNGRERNAQPTTLFVYRETAQGEYSSVNIWSDGSFAVSEDTIGVSVETLDFLKQLVAEQFAAPVDVFEFYNTRNIVSLELRLISNSPAVDDSIKPVVGLYADKFSVNTMAPRFREQIPMQAAQTCPYIFTVSITRANGESSVYLVNDHSNSSFMFDHREECPDYLNGVYTPRVYGQSIVPLW